MSVCNSHHLLLCQCFVYSFIGYICFSLLLRCHSVISFMSVMMSAGMSSGHPGGQSFSSPEWLFRCYCSASSVCMIYNVHLEALQNTVLSRL